MWWNTAIILVWLCIICTVVAVIVVYQKRKTGIAKPLNVLFAGIIIAALIGVLPVNYAATNGNTVIRLIEAFSLSLANVMQIFTVDMDGKELLNTIGSHKAFDLQQPYIFTMSILCTFAPLLTIGTLASVLMSLSAGRRYLFNFFRDVYIFSDLNDRSLALASDIKKHHSDSLMVFTNVIDKDNETLAELSNKAKTIGAVLFKQDILTPKFHWHKKNTKMYFFIVGDNEAENIEHSLTMIERYKNREHTRLYIFSCTRESELALTGIDKGKMKVRRVNEVQSLIYRTLYENTEKLFGNAVEQNGVKHINAVVLGMGHYGAEMTKALTWFCQMDGYQINIHAFDQDQNAESKFKVLCPDLMSEAYNGVSEKGESEYTITVHSGIDVNTSECLEILKTMSPATFIFTALGSDEENIKTAYNMRTIWQRRGFSPLIQAVVKNPKISEVLQNAVNYKKKPYDIDCIGDLEIQYSENVVINSEIETAALQRHLIWGDKDSFWEYEYNYKSSVASVVHKKARNFCRVKGNDKLNEQGEQALTDDERESLQCLEHRRWNAYMRSEGYIYGSQRDDIAKTHHCLVPYYALPEDQRHKDLF